MQRSTTTEEKPITKQQQFNIDIISGLLSGAVCAGLFNPWDRALCLSVTHSRPFLLKANFTSPYQGASQAIFQRAFLGGTYFIVQGQLTSNLYPHLRKAEMKEVTAQFCIGMLAGSISGVLTNSTSAIKYHTWGKDGRTFFSSAYEMWTLGGIKPFIKGTKATVLRDTTFGCSYEVLRHLTRYQLEKYQNNNKKNLNFYCNLIAALVATIASGPFNYARTIQYATPPNQPTLLITQILKNLWHESTMQSTHSGGRLGFFQQKLRIGWGTLRVGVGMGVGQAVFDATRTWLGKR